MGRAAHQPDIAAVAGHMRPQLAGAAKQRGLLNRGRIVVTIGLQRSLPDEPAEPMRTG